MHIIFRIALNKVLRLMLFKLNNRSSKIFISVKDFLSYMLNMIKMGEEAMLNELI